MKKKTRPKNCCTSNFHSTCWIWRLIWSILEDVKDCMLASTLVPGHRKEKENFCLLAFRSTSFSLGGVLQEGWKLLNYILPAFNTSSIHLVEHNIVQRALGCDLVILWGYCRSTGWPSNLTASSSPMYGHHFATLAHSELPQHAGVAADWGASVALEGMFLRNSQCYFTGDCLCWSVFPMAGAWAERARLSPHYWKIAKHPNFSWLLAFKRV